MSLSEGLEFPWVVRECAVSLFTSGAKLGHPRQVAH
jgi:hypothetical protein